MDIPGVLGMSKVPEGGYKFSIDSLHIRNGDHSEAVGFAFEELKIRRCLHRYLAHKLTLNRQNVTNQQIKAKLADSRARFHSGYHSANKIESHSRNKQRQERQENRRQRWSKPRRSPYA